MWCCTRPSTISPTLSPLLSHHVMALRATVVDSITHFVLFLRVERCHFPAVRSWTCCCFELTNEPNHIQITSNIVPIPIPLSIQYNTVLFSIVVIRLILPPRWFPYDLIGLRPPPCSRSKSSISLNSDPVEMSNSFQLVQFVAENSNWVIGREEMTFPTCTLGRSRWICLSVSNWVLINMIL